MDLFFFLNKKTLISEAVKVLMCENIIVMVSDLGGMPCQANCNVYLMLISDILCSWLKTNEMIMTGI